MKKLFVLVLALLLSGCTSSVGQTPTPEGFNATLTEELTITETPWSPTDTPPPAATNTTTPSPSPTSVFEQFIQLTKINHGIAGVDLDFSPDGSRLAVSGSTGLWLYRADDLTVLAKPGREAYSALTSAWSPDGSLLASQTYSPTITIWDMGSGSIAARLGRDMFLDCRLGFSWSPSGEWIANLCPPLYLWDPSGTTPPTTIDNYFSSGIYAFEWSPNGKQLAYSSGGNARKVAVVNIGDQQPVFILDGDGALSWSSDGTRLATVFGEEMLVWNITETGKPKLEVTYEADCYLKELEWSPDGSAIATVCSEGALRLWDFASQAVIRTLGEQQDQIETVAWSPDGSKLVSAAFDGSLVLWGNSAQQVSGAEIAPATQAAPAPAITSTPPPQELVLVNFTLPEGETGIWCQWGGVNKMQLRIENLARSILEGTNYGIMTYELEAEFHNLPAGMQIVKQDVSDMDPGPFDLGFEYCIQVDQPIPAGYYAIQIVLKIHPVDPTDLEDKTDQSFLSFKVLPEMEQSTVEDFIAFTSEQVGYPQGEILGGGKLKEYVTNLYAISPDGSTSKKITDLDTSALWPAWNFPAVSPDQSTIAAVLRTSGRSEGIYLISIDTQTQRKLTESGIYPAWSPDGSRIAYYDSAIWVIFAYGTGAQRLSEAQEGILSWAPDSNRLAFTWENNIWMVNVDGSGLTQLTQNGGTLPSWSPDGSKLAFVTGSAVWVINTDGSGAQQVASGTFLTEKPRWSPDGSMLAYYDSFAIYSIHVDGTSKVRLTPPEISPVGPLDWSPDGSQIVFATAQDLYIVNSDGSEMRNLTNNDFSAETFLTWAK